MNRTLLRAQLLYSEMGSSEKRVADYLLSCPDIRAPLSISELAQRSHSSEATITRFSRRLGFSGYPDLKISLAQEDPRATVSPNIGETDTCYEIFDKVCNDAYLSLERTKKIISEQALSEASEAIANAGKIVLIGLGTSASVADDMAGKLLRAGCCATAYSDTHLQAVAVSFVGPGDVVVGISQSGASKDVVEALRSARLNGATTVCITGTEHSPIIRAADIVLLTDTEETRHSALRLSSHIARQMVVDAVCYHVVSRSAALREKYLSENAGELASKRLLD